MLKRDAALHRAARWKRWMLKWEVLGPPDIAGVLLMDFGIHASVFGGTRARAGA